ncbi:MAG: hypothetical protein HYX92_08315 [Chloroflexi bacterium]|nr:hypothetical protein [Chloroflexota bacterium]
MVAQGKVVPNMVGLIPNTKVQPWNDARVRQALNLLIDREAAAKVIRGGGFYPGYGYNVPGSPFARTETELKAMPGFRMPKDQDIGEAKRLLAEAGYPNGFKVTLLTPTNIYSKEGAEFSNSELSKLGIVGTIQVLEMAVAKDRVFKGAFELTAWSEGPSLDEPDLILGGYYLTGAPQNYGGWSNKQFDELYVAQSQTSDSAKRKEIIGEMERILHKEAPRILITWGKYWAVWWSEVANWAPHRSVKRNHQFRDVWLAR